MKLIKILSTFLLLVIQVSAFGQILKLDLAKYQPGKEHKLDYDNAGIEEIILSNIHPKIDEDESVNKEYIYRFNYEIVTIPLETLPLSKINHDSQKVTLSKKCEKFKKIIDSAFIYLENPEFNEIDWKNKYLDKLRKYLDKNDCNDLTLKEAEALINKSIKIESLAKPIKIKRGQQLKIFVSRGTSSKTVWEFVIDGGEVGKWFVHYGYGIVSPFKNHGGHFFTQQNENLDDYTVVKMEERGRSARFLPSIMYSFIPYKSYNKNFSFSLTGGLGANSDDIAVLFGISMFFWENLGVNLYVAGINQSVLKGRYKKDGSSIVKENLDFDALHQEEFRPHYGFSVSFRFSDNPFNENKDDK